MRRSILAALAAVIGLAACGGGGSPAGTRAAAAPRAGRQSPSQPSATASAARSGDWTQFGYDGARSGVGPADTGINAGNVGSLTVRAIHIPGVADTSAVEL